MQWRLVSLLSLVPCRRSDLSAPQPYGSILASSPQSGMTDALDETGTTFWGGMSLSSLR